MSIIERLALMRERRLEDNELRRLNHFVAQFYAGKTTKIDSTTMEPYDIPIDMSLEDWTTPAGKLLHLETTTKEAVIGLGPWYSDYDGHLCDDLATPIFEKKNNPENLKR